MKYPKFRKYKNDNVLAKGLIFLFIGLLFLTFYFLHKLRQKNTLENLQGISIVDKGNTGPEALPEANLYVPPLTLTPTPVGFVRSDKEWSYFESIAGFSFKSPKNWFTNVSSEDVKFLLKHQDSLTAVTVIPEGEDSDQMPGNYDFFEVIFPIDVNAKHTDIGKSYEKGFPGLMEQNPGSYFSTVDGKRALISVSKPGNPPENFQGDWSNQYSKFIYVDLGDNRILTISYYYDTDGENNMKMFESIINSIKFD